MCARGPLANLVLSFRRWPREAFMHRFSSTGHVVVAVLLLAVVGALAGCSSRGSGGSSGSAAGGGGGQDAAAVWHDLVQCARANGMPNLPEPRIDENGQPQWPGGEPPRPPQQVMTACKSIIDRLPAEVATNDGADPANVPALLRFAACVRDHGIPSFPDPMADGRFPASIKRDRSRQFLEAMDACMRLNPDANGQLYVR
jgi:hypothetical protein